MKKIVLASSNAGKVREINNLLLQNNIEVVPQSAFDIPDAIEDGLSFVENAIIKARHAAKLSGSPAIADDSGIEVDALNHRPGIYSARYSGEGATSEKNNQKMLGELEGVAEENRSARYQCVMVFMRDADDPMPIITQGSLEGRILEAPRGEGGFGYDPIFYLPDHKCAAAEISLEEKNKISHRAIALNAMIARLKDTGIIS
ncbi:MAG: RdgB/HAM1 family non-canonical purine NTP pyrophosphatase [Gammaproteobacteria bacterium]|nr:RdgB/HAM1 family non-canonical purine NTP pyrophosphatase [Gammaproteobacteria bacterium]MCW8909268.1 RdgB/HAM1 family non-canonical purine NTP pyrophosphatase [Gammaproteobacteria bacterium]MCW9004298.1 RdgB/HAM1 family non-canonical purine NTP pyrophosphatase [Gammaproteobacteria bacterium]MCW9055536.1 RdgB/HAM1 family non-canonical purine NTP pyrophosphatase [Gammaproteobacteria bacterium]